MKSRTLSRRCPVDEADSHTDRRADAPAHRLRRRRKAPRRKHEAARDLAEGASRAKRIRLTTGRPRRGRRPREMENGRLREAEGAPREGRSSTPRTFGRRSCFSALRAKELLEKIEQHDLIDEAPQVKFPRRRLQRESAGRPKVDGRRPPAGRRSERKAPLLQPNETISASSRSSPSPDRVPTRSRKADGHGSKRRQGS